MDDWPRLGPGRRLAAVPSFAQRGAGKGRRSGPNDSPALRHGLENKLQLIDCKAVARNWVRFVFLFARRASCQSPWSPPFRIASVSSVLVGRWTIGLDSGPEGDWLLCHPSPSEGPGKTAGLGQTAAQAALRAGTGGAKRCRRREDSRRGRLRACATKQKASGLGDPGAARRGERRPAIPSILPEAGATGLECRADPCSPGWPS